jgi:26S proteasome regulatory subunit N2
MIAMAMVLQQQSDAAVPYTKEFRQYLRKRIDKKKTEIQVFGVCLAYGILNAGGRNVVISCNSLRGENSVLATVGLALFCNYFYWHPLALMLPLAFHPTAIIGLDKDLRTPEWRFLSKGNRKLFENPPAYESEKEVVQITKVALSIRRRPTTPVPEVPVETVPEEPEDADETEVLANQSRVTIRQLSKVEFDPNERYKPITGEIFHGFVMLKDSRTDL